ncbi:hypothetical protein QN277_024404 [Acacia crassicarpa]|uniref:Uncharacterized protein n=1 Tax=Acacia crassicarpa TaxID=499986 RepID=A0AAE1JC23_9FABA|nr:hypothetical protein QN277_024404 [Acacia crassicarpa]
MAVAMAACSVRTQFIDNRLRRDSDKSIRYEVSSSFVASKSLRILKNLRFSSSRTTLIQLSLEQHLSLMWRMEFNGRLMSFPLLQL